MTDTAMVPRKNSDRPDGPASLIDEQLADQLLGKAQAEGVDRHGGSCCRTLRSRCKPVSSPGLLSWLS
jgi:hypothetical protein